MADVKELRHFVGVPAGGSVSWETHATLDGASQDEALAAGNEPAAARPLSPERRAHSLDLWSKKEALFDQAPAEAVRDAQQLVSELMKERGRPSVVHQEVKVWDGQLSTALTSLGDIYRLARDVQAAARGMALAKEYREASREDLTQAMAHYRTMFERLLAAS